MSAVQFNNISKKYGRQQVLDQVTFEIPKNSVFGLLGQNGAGKTTLFSIAAGFVKPEQGSVKVLDIDVENMSRLMGKFSMLPQDAQFQAGIPVIEQLIMFGLLNGMDQPGAEVAALDALKLVGLEHVSKKSARALSHGMAKRVALCQAFIGDPEVIFLDEPTAGLDPDNAKNVRDIIKSLSANKTVVVSSHNLREIEDICDNVAILHQGNLVECSSVADLTNSSGIVRLELSADLTDDLEAAILAIPSVSSLERSSSDTCNLVLSQGNSKSCIEEVMKVLNAHGIYPKSLQEGASLESRFLELTGGGFDGASST
jgi:ABC-type multidrug transport system ATPase subunit